jgi:hypothetical protein
MTQIEMNGQIYVTRNRAATNTGLTKVAVKSSAGAFLVIQA